MFSVPGLSIILLFITAVIVTILVDYTHTLILQIYSVYVTYYREDGGPFNGIDLPEPEFALLNSVDIRNSTKCLLVDNLDQIDIDSSDLLLIHLNIHSLPAHLDELEVLLKNLNHDLSLMFIGISETWLKPLNERLYVLQNFQIVAKSTQQIRRWVSYTVAC